MEENNIEEFKKYVLDMMGALNDKIDALNDVVVNQIMKPAIEQYQNERYEAFKGKYGERLSKYDGILKKTFGDDYDNTREAWNRMNEAEEGAENYDVEGAVADMEKQTLEFVNKIRGELGLEADAPVDINVDEKGNVDVKADTNGDGVPNETVAETKTETAESETETTDEGEDEEIDPELQKELDAYLKQ